MITQKDVQEAIESFTKMPNLASAGETSGGGGQKLVMLLREALRLMGSARHMRDRDAAWDMHGIDVRRRDEWRNDKTKWLREVQELFDSRAGLTGQAPSGSAAAVVGDGDSIPSPGAEPAPSESRAELIARLAPGYEAVATKEEAEGLRNLAVRRAVYRYKSGTRWIFAWCDGNQDEIEYIWLRKIPEAPKVPEFTQLRRITLPCGHTVVSAHRQAPYIAFCSVCAKPMKVSEQPTEAPYEQFPKVPELRASSIGNVPTPYELWKLAGEDQKKYHELLDQHYGRRKPDSAKVPETRAELIARLAPGYEECSYEDADRYNDYSRSGLRRMGEGLHYIFCVNFPHYVAPGVDTIWLRRLRKIPEPALPEWVTKAGFEACGWDEAAHGNNEYQRLGIRNSDGYMQVWVEKSQGIAWLRPARAPEIDAERLVFMLEEQWHCNLTDVQKDDIRAALAELKGGRQG